MATIKFQAWFRINDEKDFYNGEMEADNFAEVEKSLKEKDRRIFNVYQL